ncbi:MAG: ABC transporter ATP-binding protein/permease [Firmicutes bacterium]|nr:ABC transporter ATP-binding protein/permease [Bacillota bacterium]
MPRIFKYFKWHDVLTIVFIGGFVVLQVWLELLMPEYMIKATEFSFTGAQPVLPDIWLNGGIMLACAAGGLACALATIYLATRMSSGFAARLAQLIFERVESFSAEEISRFSTPSLITRTTNDVVQVRMLTGMGTHLLLRAPIMAVWALYKIGANTWEFITLTAAVICVMLSLVLFVVLAVLPKFRRIQTLTDSLNRLTRENLTGIRVIRAFNAEQFQEERFERANQDITKTQLFTTRTMQALMPAMMLLLTGLTLGISVIGAFLIHGAAPVAGAGQSEILGAAAAQGALYGDMLAFSQYAMMALTSFLMMVMVFIMLPRAAVSARRIMEVLDTKPAILSGAGAQDNPARTGEVEFRGVSFKYPGAEEYVLADISFSVKQGETAAFIGSTGSGKSTLINLVPRFYDACEGEVLVEGVNVKQYTLPQLTDKLGYVPQKGVIFSGTLRENVDFGAKEPPLTDEEIARALTLAQAKEFTDTLQDGYEAKLARGGTNLSGGQQQRLSIARALARKRSILIFDDSFSALDFKTDKKLRAAINTELSGVTKLIVAQRIGTIKEADKIVVLEKGRAVGIGKHAELLKTCEVYREIALSQFSKEELGL